MSEYIDNATRRKETLKNVLRQLNAGRSVSDVQAEFAVLAKEVSSAEIAQIEQEMINEGTDPAEIQKLCDVHVSVFRYALEQAPETQAMPGHPVQIMQAENRILGRFLSDIRKAIEAATSEQEETVGKNYESLRKQAERLSQFDRHYLRKENLLFPFLEKYGFQGPSKVMWGIHDDIRTQLKEYRALLAVNTPDLEAILSTFETMDQAMRGMIYKEEKILIPAAVERLTKEDWAAIRLQEDEIGWFMITPGVDWPPKARAATIQAEAHNQPPGQPEVEQPKINPVEANSDGRSERIHENENSYLSLQVGEMTLDQIRMMLTHLPVDITFVDENDEVRFFSQTKDRIFPRLPAIIGRKVQNCHPHSSLDRVQRIIDDFRAGRRDEAEFWIQMQGKFVHIQYFAVRNEEGRYHGTLEVTQDLTAVRKLEGERRILDE